MITDDDKERIAIEVEHLEPAAADAEYKRRIRELRRFRERTPADPKQRKPTK